MDDFITNDVTPQFLGTGWQTNMSNATDQQIVSRIALNETTETSTSANSDGIKKLAMAAAMVTSLMSDQHQPGGEGHASSAARRHWSAKR